MEKVGSQYEGVNVQDVQIQEALRMAVTGGIAWSPTGNQLGYCVQNNGMG